MRKAFAALVAIQIIFLLGEAAHYTLRANSGTVIKLKVLPVDPRSLFMGNYMTMNYEISSVSAAAMSLSPSLLTPGTVVFARVRPGEPNARPAGFSLAVPRFPPAGVVYIKGTVEAAWQGRATVRYGIERYYIPESRQQEVNDLWSGRRRFDRAADVSAEISIDRSGRALLKGIWVNGKRLDY